MPVEHVIFDEQTTNWKTWETPDKAIRVDSWSIDPGEQRVTRRLTGKGRGLKYSTQGPKTPTGSFEMPAWPVRLGYWLKAASLHDIANAVVDSSSAYDHGFVPKDDTMPLGLSVQVKRDGTHAQNLIGVLLNRLTFSCQAGEPLTLSGDWIAYDEAPTSGSWTSGVAAPSVIATPSYFSDSLQYLMFHQATIMLDQSLTWVDASNFYTYTGGSAQAAIEMVEVAIENGLDPRVFLSSRLAGNVIGQDRSVTARFDIDQSTVSETFLTKLRAASSASLSIKFVGAEIETGYNYELEIILPNLDVTSAPMPDLAGGNDRRMQSVEMTALLDDNDIDVAIRLRDTETAY